MISILQFLLSRWAQTDRQTDNTDLYILYHTWFVFSPPPPTPSHRVTPLSSITAYTLIYCIFIAFCAYFALTIQCYLPKYSSVNWDQLHIICRWWMVSCFPVFKWQALKGSKVGPVEMRLEPVSAMAKAACVSRLRVLHRCLQGEAMWIHAEGWSIEQTGFHFPLTSLAVLGLWTCWNQKTPFCDEPMFIVFNNIVYRLCLCRHFWKRRNNK